MRTTAMAPTSNTDEDSGHDISRNDAPAIVESSVIRRGGFTGPPDRIEVTVTYLRERDNVQATSTPVFDVDEQGVASLAESDGDGTVAEKFIPIAIAAEQITELPSVNRIEGVPSFEFMTESIGSVIGAKPELTSGEDTTTHTDTHTGEQTTKSNVAENGSGTHQEPAEPSESETTQTTQITVENLGSHLHKNSPTNWQLEDPPKEGVVEQIGNVDTDEYITIWDMGDGNTAEYVVVFYGDETVEEPVADLNEVVEVATNWIASPPIPA